MRHNLGTVADGPRVEAVSREPDERLLADYQSALVAAKTGIWVHDILSDRIQLDPLMLRIWGYTVDEVGGSLDEWNRRSMHPDDLPGWRDAYHGHLEGRTDRYEHTHRRRERDGSYRWMFSRGHAERDARGRAVRMLGVVTDITELQEARESVRQIESRVRQIAEYSSDVYWLVEAATGKILYVSPAFERIWGYPAQHILDGTRRWADAVLPEDRPKVRSLALLQRLDEWDISYRLRHTDGSIRWVQLRGFPILKDGVTERVAFVMKDITQDRAEDERRLAALRRQSELLVREVHHRIKNSLQGMTGLLAIHMREHPEVAAPLAEAMTKIESVALVHGLLGSSFAGDVGVVPMTRAIVDMAQRYAGQDAGVVLETRDGLPVRVVPDKSVAVALILNELLTNAIKHRQPVSGTPVRVNVDVRDDQVVWRISNAGALTVAADLDTGHGLGTGLNLVRSMLPAKGAGLRLFMEPGSVIAELVLSQPVIEYNEASE